MLNDKQRETVKDYFKTNPKATPQDIEKLLGFKMDMMTVITITGLRSGTVIPQKVSHPLAPSIFAAS